MQQYSLRESGIDRTLHLVVEDVLVCAVGAFFHRHGVDLKKERFFALSDPFRSLGSLRCKMEVEEQGRQDREDGRQPMGCAHYWYSLSDIFDPCWTVQLEQFSTCSLPGLCLHSIDFPADIAPLVVLLTSGRRSQRSWDVRRPPSLELTQDTLSGLAGREDMPLE